MRVFFVSQNKHKYEELNNIIKEDLIDCELIWHAVPIWEFQTENAEQLVKHKVIDAFKETQRSVLVEHTALEIEAFNHMLGLYTKHFYDRLEAEQIINYCKCRDILAAKAISWLGFCDGKSIKIVKGELLGWITDELDKESEGFDWDRIFIPDDRENI